VHSRRNGMQAPGRFVGVAWLLVMATILLHPGRPPGAGDSENGLLRWICISAPCNGANVPAKDR